MNKQALENLKEKHNQDFENLKVQALHRITGNMVELIVENDGIPLDEEIMVNSNDHVVEIRVESDDNVFTIGKTVEKDMIKVYGEDKNNGYTVAILIDSHGNMDNVTRFLTDNGIQCPFRKYFPIYVGKHISKVWS